MILKKSRKRSGLVIYLYFCTIVEQILREIVSAFSAVKRVQSSKLVKGVPFVNRKYKNGWNFLIGLDLRVESPPIKLLRVPPPRRRGGGGRRRSYSNNVSRSKY